MKIKVELELEIQIDKSSGYIDSLTQEIVNEIHKRTGLKKELIFIDFYEVKEIEML